MINIIKRYLTRNPCYKQGRIIAVRGLMLHSVGCSQPNPLVFVNNWNNESFGRACVHGFLGGSDAYITLPIMETKGRAMRGWHGGGSSNNTHIGVEMCEPSCIKYTGGSTFTCSNYPAAVAYVERTTRTAAELFAQLCIFHDLDPLKDGVIISHAEGYKRGVASNHGDPDHLWRGLNMNYNMDKFRADVAAIVAELTAPPEEEEEEVRYKFIDDVPSEEFKTVLNTLVEAEVLHGTGFEDGKRVVDLSHDMIRNIVFEYRGGAFDRKLVAKGLPPVVNV